jgi:predicted TIM-barrel fold metal-dependent hydrolase
VLQDSVKLISVDDHVIEHPRVWLDRLPGKYQELAPRVIEIDRGREAWSYLDEIVPIYAGQVQLQKDVPMELRGAIRFDEMRPGCYDPVARLADMDEDGVWAQLCFPNFARFAGHRFMPQGDPELSLLCIQAYNDFLLDEWCKGDPARYIGMALIPLWDLDASIREIERVAAKDARAIAFSENPTVIGLPSVYTDHWDPLWEAVTAADLPVCMHIGSSSKVPESSPDATGGLRYTIVGTNSMIACADWLFCSALERFPKMQVVFSEGGVGWLPYITERADKSYLRMRERSGSSTLPSDLVRDHVHVCMATEYFPMRALDQFPIDNVLWEGDYPHDEGLWPHNRKSVAESMVDVPDEIAAQICEGNPRRLFKIEA